MAKFFSSPSLAILDKNCSRNGFRRPEILNFLGGMPQTPPLWACIVRFSIWCTGPLLLSSQPPYPKTSSYAAALAPQNERWEEMATFSRTQLSTCTAIPW